MNYYRFLAELINHNLISGSFLENGIESIKSSCITSDYLVKNNKEIQQTIEEFLQWYEGNNSCLITPKRIEKVLAKAQQTIVLGEHKEYNLDWAISRIRCEQARRIQAKFNSRKTKDKTEAYVSAIWIALGLVLGLWMFFVPLQVYENSRLQKEIEQLKELLDE